MNYLVVSASIMPIRWVGEGFFNFRLKTLLRGCEWRGGGWCVLLLWIQALKLEFDPDLEVNDSASQNLVSHQKHGDDHITVRVL